MEGRGPLVPKPAHRAGQILLLAAIGFTAAMGVAQAAYAGYSDVGNAISDLGNSQNSPLYLVFNVGIVAFGLLGLWDAWLLRTAFRPKLSSTVGIGLFVVAFVGAIGVGLFPEEIQPAAHGLFALVTFLASGLALLLLAWSMLRDTRWDGLRLYTAVSGAVTLGAIALLFSALGRSGDFGAIERLVVGPPLLWSGIAGGHLWRMPVYDPKPANPSASDP